MFSRKKQYLKIQKIHHKALKVVYNGNKIYDEFLWDNNEVSIHQRNLGALICEVLKSLNNLNPEFFKNTTYNIRNGPLLRSASYGINSVLLIVMSGWFLLASTIVQYQRKMKLLKLNKILEKFIL